MKTDKDTKCIICGFLVFGNHICLPNSQHDKEDPEQQEAWEQLNKAMDEMERAIKRMRSN